MFKKESRQEDLQFDCETLEQRQMLSSVDIFAAGTTNEEIIELQIDGQTVQTIENIGGDANSGSFVKLSYESESPVDASQIRIAFVNDLYDPANGIDRNVRIDKIVVDGQVIETESSDIFSTGSWKPEDGVVAGFRESEFLNSNGYFQFPSRDSGNTGSELEIRVKGDEGTEQFNLLIKGQVVGTFSVTQQFQTIRFTASETVSADDVRIEFFNDRWEPANGVDANLTVDNIKIDGVTFETEDPSVFSTGSWKAEDGIVDGFRQSQTLNSNGYFQYAVNAASPTTLTPTPATNGVIIGTPQDDDVLVGTSGNDVFETRGGFDFVFGEGGFDTVRLPGLRSDYDVFLDEPTGRYNFTNLATVEGALLTDVEKVEFIASGESVFISNGNLPPTTPAPVSPAAPSTPIDQPNSGVSIIDPQTGQTIDLSGIFASLSPEAQAVFAAGIADLNGSVTPTPAPTPTPTLPNAAPNANDDPGNVTNANTPITLDVLANDTDSDRNSLTITDASVPSSQGTVAIVNNRLVYTPAQGFGGVTTEIRYTVSDSNGGSDSATAFVYVFPGNTQAPTPTPTPDPAPSGVIAGTPQDDDVLEGTPGNDVFETRGGFDFVFGEGGFDTVRLPGVRGDYDVFLDEPTGRYNFTNLQTVEGALLTDIERVEFIGSGESVIISNGALPPTTPTPTPVAPTAPSTPVSSPNSGLSITDPETGEVIDLSGIFASLDPGAQGAFAAGVAGVNGGATPAPAPTPVAPVVPSTPVSSPNTGLSITDPETGEVIDLSGIFASLDPGAQGAFAAGVAGVNGGATPIPTPAPAPTPTPSPSPTPAASNTTSRGIFTGTPAAAFDAYPFPARYDSPDQIVPPGNYDLSDAGIQSYIDSGAAPYTGVSFNRAYLQGEIGGTYLSFQVGRDVQNGVPFDVAAARAVAAYPF